MRTWKKISPPNRIMFVLVWAVFQATACSPSPNNQLQTGGVAAPVKGSPRSLVVFAAASLTEAFTQLGERFEAGHPGTELAFNFAGSQQLAQQLAQGAPADVFASANLDQMEAIANEGLTSPGSEQVFLHNRLVVVLYPGAAGGIQQLQDLAKPGVILILAGETVPVGKYARQSIHKAGQDPAFEPGFEQSVLENVVSNEENVRAVLSKVILGEADAGIVYTSDAVGVAGEQIRVLDIPENLNVEASYYIAPLLNSRQPDLADEFIAFILSDEGQQVLADNGFLPVHTP